MGKEEDGDQIFFYINKTISKEETQEIHGGRTFFLQEKIH